jgi:hypothetical protein
VHNLNGKEPEVDQQLPSVAVQEVLGRCSVSPSVGRNIGTFSKAFRVIRLLFLPLEARVSWFLHNVIVIWHMYLP